MADPSPSGPGGRGDFDASGRQWSQLYSLADSDAPPPKLYSQIRLDPPPVRVTLGRLPTTTFGDYGSPHRLLSITNLIVA